MPDPQPPRGPRSDRPVRTDSAGQDLLKQYGLAAVVIKHAVHGALVFTPGNDPTRTGVHPTTHVHPIGSGDAFTAGFAHAWFTGADPQAAAGAASRAPAAYCATGSPFHVADLLETVPVETVPGQGRLYLAGPFFSTAERWLIEHLRDALDALDVAVFSPLHDVGLGGDEVAARDLAGLDQATGVLAILDGHDCGALLEIGCQSPWPRSSPSPWTPPQRRTRCCAAPTVSSSTTSPPPPTAPAGRPSP